MYPYELNLVQIGKPSVSFVIHTLFFFGVLTYPCKGLIVRIPVRLKRCGMCSGLETYHGHEPPNLFPALLLTF